MPTMMRKRRVTIAPPVASVVITIDGEPFGVRAFVDQDAQDMRSCNGMSTFLRGLDGEEFEVFEQAPTAVMGTRGLILKRPKHRYFCGKCGPGSCRHALALASTNLV